MRIFLHTESAQGLDHLKRAPLFSSNSDAMVTQYAGFARPPHMDAQPFSTAQNVDPLNSLSMLQGRQSENGAHRIPVVDFQSNNNAGLEACSIEGEWATIIGKIRSWFGL